jgi:signal transduction histidine kinase
MQRNILDSVTHELKTPLASLRLHTETILMRPLSEENRNGFLKKSVHEIERLERLIDEILVAARLESGIPESEKHPHPLLPILEESYLRVRERVGGRRVFSFYKTEKVPHATFEIMANQRQIEMVFNNILENAVKYTPEGGSISVEVAIANDSFSASFTDSGYGIEKNDLNRIFEKFYRARSQQKQRVTGSGLGLFVCRTILKSHGGKIFATSPGPGKGATFHVEFERTPRSR